MYAADSRGFSETATAQGDCNIELILYTKLLPGKGGNGEAVGKRWGFHWKRQRESRYNKRYKRLVGITFLTFCNVSPNNNIIFAVFVFTNFINEKSCSIRILFQFLG